ncbi:glycoside hydrolase family 5 protein [Pseudomonas paraversuta]|uniref:glycoside hydrolase family 5 protein n=1 Tax=Pseudomonas paraversuta TaxID=2750624 RepID=UPI001F25B4BA|nr:cellulase family glycosylhydrolase [Pseudomonas paraversuta]
MKLRTMPALWLLGVLSGAAGAADMIAFWDKPERGGNSFNRLPPDQAYFDALQDYGASWVRLSYDKWQPAERDYLIGNADQYQGLVAKDLQQLKTTLDRAHAAGLKVVITPLSLPGMRWAQNNGDRFDDRLWQDKQFWTQSAAFWRDLAAVLKEHPAVAAYNLINEPAPEKQAGLAEHADAAKMRDWYEKQVGSARDLPGFYQTLISAIREVDPLTPIMVDAGWYGAADAFSYWPAPLADSRVLYSFHMYEPYAATSAPNLQRARPYTYPGLVPFAAGMQKWDPNRVRSYLQLPLDWAAQHAIPANRMVAGEFGCMRKLPGCQQYLEDVLSALEAARVHWAFYSFREDSWDGMDYEQGSANVPWAYWKAAEDGQPDPVKRSATAEFEPISKRLKKSE